MSTKNIVKYDGVEYTYGSNQAMAAAFAGAVTVTGCLSDRALLQRADTAYDHNLREFTKHRHASHGFANTLLWMSRNGVDLKKLIEEIEQYV